MRKEDIKPISELCKFIEDKKGEDVTLFDLTEKEYIIICKDISGNHNTINGIVYDHGSIAIKPRSTKGRRPFNIVETVKSLKN